jgi:hypothetical protein
VRLLALGGLGWAGPPACLPACLLVFVVAAFALHDDHRSSSIRPRDWLLTTTTITKLLVSFEGPLAEIDCYVGSANESVEPNWYDLI